MHCRLASRRVHGRWEADCGCGHLHGIDALLSFEDVEKLILGVAY
jgi:hypothetical protein